MGVYRTYRCPKCSKALEDFVPDQSRGVGEPFRQCDRCQTYVIMKELFNEWDLLTPSEQKGMHYRAIWTAFQLGGLAGVVLGMISVGWFMKTVSQQTPFVFALYVGGAAALGFYIHFYFVKRGLADAIRQSKQRMTDAAYRARLAELGLLNR